MAVRQADFVNSVKFLQSLHQKDGDEHSHKDFKAIPAINHRLQTLSSQPIGEILAGVLPSIHGGIAGNRKAEPKSDQSTDARQTTVTNRIETLEQKIRLLERHIRKIAQAIDDRPTSK